MTSDLTLASSSQIRRELLQNAGLSIDVVPARVDEESMIAALLHSASKPRDIADALAEAKAKKVSGKGVAGLVLGCDQVLELDGAVFSKPASQAEARSQLQMLRGKPHHLHSAAVLYRDSQPIWRQVSSVTLKMRLFTDDYLEDYLARNWEDIRHCVGGYMLEKEGARLMERIEGDYFAVLGLPLLELLGQLAVIGAIDA